jgi:hypothetical protein
VVLEFLQACDNLNYDSGSVKISNTAGTTPNNISMADGYEAERNYDDEQQEELQEQQPVNEYDDPEFYGVPKSFLNRHKVAAVAATAELPAAAVVTEIVAQEDVAPKMDGEGAGETETDVGADESKEGEGAGAMESVPAPTEVPGPDPQSSEEPAAVLSVEEQAARDAEAQAAAAAVAAAEELAAEQKAAEEAAAAEAAAEAEAAEALRLQEEQLSAFAAADGTTLQRGMSTLSLRAGAAAAATAAQDTPALLRELSQVLLDLCLDFSADPAAAAQMCERNLCDGCVLMIDKDARLNPRDPRISHTIELMWNVLEPFIEQFKAHNASPDDVRQQLSHFSDQVVDFGRAVEVLQSVILFVQRSGFRVADKELRNEVLIILTMLAQFPCAVGYFIDCGLFHLLLTYACIDESGPESWDSYSADIGKIRNFATVADIDLEFKREIWFVVSELLRSNDPDALRIFASSPLQATVLQYMEHDSFDPHAHAHGHGHSRRADAGTGMGTGMGAESFNMSASMNASHDDTMYSKSQVVEEHKKEGTINHAKHRLKPPSATAMAAGNSTTFNGSTMSNPLKSTIMKKSIISQLPLSKLREFQLLAVAFLLHNAPRVLETFEELGGPVRVIALTLRYCQSDVADHKSFILYCLMLLQKCLVQSLAVRAFMEQNNMVQSFLYVYHKSDHEETQAQALRLIATLCANHNRPLQRSFDQLGGISDLVRLLANYVRKRPPLVGTKAGVKLTVRGESLLPDPFENPFGGEISVLIIAVLDCLVNVLVGNQALEATFAELEGIDVLLELMETSPFVLRLQALRFLSDVLVNKKLTIYANAWRSPKTLRSAAQILCHGWLDEEARVIGVKRLNGIVSDLSRPLGFQITNDPSQSGGGPAVGALSPAAVASVGKSGGAAGSPAAVSASMSPTEQQQQQQQLQESGWGTGDFGDYGDNNNNGYGSGEGGVGGVGGAGGDQEGPASPRESVAASSSVGVNYAEQALANGSTSLTVSKLASAILAGRNATQTNLPIEICTGAMERDSRVLVASILGSLGVYELYDVFGGGGGSVGGGQDHLGTGAGTVSGTQSQFGFNASLVSGGGGGGSGRGVSSAPQRLQMQQPQEQQQQQQHGGGRSPPTSPKQVNFQEFPSNAEMEEMAGYGGGGGGGSGGLNSVGGGPSVTLQSQSNVDGAGGAGGASNPLGLAPSDLQVLAMARHYSALREGEWWQAVRRSAEEEAQVVPIEADLALVNSRLQLSCDAAGVVQQEQITLYNDDDRMKKEEEEDFIGQIITKKEQQIKAEWLKKNGTKLVARAPGTTKVGKH